MSFKTLYQEVKKTIQESSEQGISLDDAEKFATKLLYANIEVSEELKRSDLDVRMRKAGLKAVKAAVYMEAATKDGKKPSDTLLEQVVTMHEVVQSEQDTFDKAEIEKEELERIFNTFKEAHIHFRNISKGRFE